MAVHANDGSSCKWEEHLSFRDSPGTSGPNSPLTQGAFIWNGELEIWHWVPANLSYPWARMISNRQQVLSANSALKSQI